jgi:hypothetical protein
MIFVGGKARRRTSRIGSNIGSWRGKAQAAVAAWMNCLVWRVSAAWLRRALLQLSNMNKFSFLVLSFLAAVSTASAQTAPSPAQTPPSLSSRVAFFAQPSVVVAFPGDFDTAAGGALALGLTLNRVHSLEVEVIRFESGLNSVDVTFMPILATYKYRIQLAKKLSLKVGGSIGATRETAQFWWGDHNQTAFTFGAVGGISYALNERVSLDGNVLALRLEETDITSSGNIAIITAGVNFRF